MQGDQPMRAEMDDNFVSSDIGPLDQGEENNPHSYWRHSGPFAGKRRGTSDQPLLQPRLPELDIVKLEQAGGLRKPPPGQSRPHYSRCRRDNHGSVISVADHGSGIPPGDRQHVFKRFYRLERSRSSSGNGLGLSLVAAVALLHGATIEMDDNAPGLKIPICFPPLEQPTPTPIIADYEEFAALPSL